MKIVISILFGCLPLMTIAQSWSDSSVKKVSIGVEADVLPYLTGGYYGSVWVSHQHFRYRGIWTQVTTPDFILDSGFANNQMMVYALVTDYFFRNKVERWWVGAGVEYWDASIQTDIKTSTAKYSNLIATAGCGYIWKVYQNLYINPWAAFHVRAAGDKNVVVDNKIFMPAFFTPEASLKIGWFFNIKKR
ncbi:MAG: hypothetical protein K1X55_17945 [Chitinophagales bacterium]|nr:hypothetical protein [Chitinophagales bacterium]